ncbi:MAG: hypothetical protein H6828_10595 [Planctomycetes bacterium]|nr:hypothetical protein [Planctomycetota bacterium]
MASELATTRWWLDHLKTWTHAHAPTRPEVWLDALHHLRDHLRKCYELEEQLGLRGPGDAQSPGISRLEERLFEMHGHITRHLETLLRELEAHPKDDPRGLLDRLSTFLAECEQLDLEETQFVQGITYAEYGAGD